MWRSTVASWTCASCRRHLFVAENNLPKQRRERRREHPVRPRDRPRPQRTERKIARSAGSPVGRRSLPERRKAAEARRAGDGGGISCSERDSEARQQSSTFHFPLKGRAVLSAEYLQRCCNVTSFARGNGSARIANRTVDATDCLPSPGRWRVRPLPLAGEVTKYCKRQS